MFLDNPKWNFLPGRIRLERGSAGDYRTLAPFHYAAGAPATWAAVWTLRFVPHGPDAPRTIGVGVLSWPIPSCRARERFLGLPRPLEQKLPFINRHLRTISRVIIHPQFRALGLSTVLVRCLCEHCPTRYVEAIARMGMVHPLFLRAGMKRTNPRRRDEPAHFIFERIPPPGAGP